MPDGTQQARIYVPPALGFETLKNAAALIRCVAAGDADGIDVIRASTADPQFLATMVATLTTAICRRVGLHNPAIDHLLAEATSQVGDLLLDQAKPVGGGE